jgi:tRNA U34 5-carboxymethylaminomethyl modifying enzyme MnmG/GidA
LRKKLVEACISLDRINGTTGYEEAASRLMAGLMHLKVKRKAPLILKEMRLTLGIN